MEHQTTHKEQKNVKEAQKKAHIDGSKKQNIFATYRYGPIEGGKNTDRAIAMSCFKELSRDPFFLSFIFSLSLLPHFLSLKQRRHQVLLFIAHVHCEGGQGHAQASSSQSGYPNLVLRPALGSGLRGVDLLLHLRLPHSLGLLLLLDLKHDLEEGLLPAV